MRFHALTSEAAPEIGVRRSSVSVPQFSQQSSHQVMSLYKLYRRVYIHGKNGFAKISKNLAKQI